MGCHRPTIISDLDLPIDIQISPRDVNSCFGSHHQIPSGVRGRALGLGTSTGGRRCAAGRESLCLYYDAIINFALIDTETRPVVDERDGWWHKWPFCKKFVHANFLILKKI